MGSRVSELSDRLRRAAATERTSEHHWAADLMSEAAVVIEHLHEEINRLEDATEREGERA